MMHAREVAPATLTYGARVTPCEPEHAVVKASEEQWAALSFAGIHPLGEQLFECRHCPLCDSTLIRLVSLARALDLLFADLLTTSPPQHTTARSAMLLQQWVSQNVPPTLGILSPPAASEAGQRACSR